MLEGALHLFGGGEATTTTKQTKNTMTVEETDCRGKEKSFFLIFEQGTLNFHFSLGPQIM